MDITPQFEFKVALIIGALIAVSFSAFLLLFMLYSNKRQTAILIDKKNQENFFQKELTRQLIEAEERTKQALAAELHDDIGSALTAIKIMLISSINSKSLNENARSNTLTEITEEITDVIARLRDLSSLLLPIEFQNHSLKKALEIYLPKLRSIANSEVRWDIIAHDDNLSTADKLALFRIIQEAASNAIKYSNASSININLKIVMYNFELSIADDGIGFDVNSKTLGLGLNNMKARAETIGASFVIASEPLKGVQINIQRKSS